MKGKFFILTVVGIVSDNVVPPAPVPQQQRGISGTRDDVAVATDVRLGSGQTRHHVPVTKDDLGQLACKNTRVVSNVLWLL